MEVSVESTEGIPDGSILSIRAGNMRRQGSLPAEKPVRFTETTLLEACPFKVDVFAPMGGSRVVLKPRTEIYNLDLGREGGSPMKLSIKVSELRNEEKEGQAPQVNEAKQQKKAKAVNETQAYIEEHDIVQFVQNLIATVLAEKPSDPFGYMERQLATRHDGKQKGQARIGRVVPPPLQSPEPAVMNFGGLPQLKAPTKTLSNAGRSPSARLSGSVHRKELSPFPKDFRQPSFTIQDKYGKVKSVVPLGSSHVLGEDSQVIRLTVPNLSSHHRPRGMQSPLHERLSKLHECSTFVTQSLSVEGVGRKYYQMHRAGAVQKLHFDPRTVVATIVTCGGLCPGLNAVIRELVMLLYIYGVDKIWGVRGGYKGVITPEEWIELTPDSVQDIHNLGGTILMSDRGNPTEEEQARYLMQMGVRQHFIIGGDGTHKGAYDMHATMRQLGWECAVVGVPKTIDNDIPMTDRTFGFDTACTEAKKAIDAAYVEATCNAHCLGLVKLMGRHCGNIVQNACLAARCVDVVLLPEMDISLEKVLQHVLHLMQTKGHAVIVVAEGCGHTLIKSSGETDAGGNLQLADVGPWLRDKIIERFKLVKLPLSIKYIDPTYMIRAVKCNANDSVYCSVLAQNAVHAAMAGFTGVTVAEVQQQQVLLPIQCVTKLPLKRVDLKGRWFQELVSSTFQPDFTPDGCEQQELTKPSPEALKDCSEIIDVVDCLGPEDEVRQLHLDHLKDRFGSKAQPTTLTEAVQGGDLGFNDVDSWVTQTLGTGNVRLQMLKAGPRRQIYFQPQDVAATIVTCGGLCPGLNAVIRELVMMLYAYGVKKVYGIKGGYKGVVNPNSWITLNPDTVCDLHKQGGSILMNDRGNPPHADMARVLQRKGVRQHFVLGGHGTQKGAYQTHAELQALDWECSVVGIPKTIDNDISLMDRSFGFDTAMAEAQETITLAHTEATGNAHCIGLVKLCGKRCGYLTMMATCAARHVDMCLLPEMDINLDKVLDHCMHLLKSQGHAVIVIGEGCSDTLMKGVTGEFLAEDEDGNINFPDVGPWLRLKIIEHFADQQLPITVKYIDPTYQIRAVPANANDSIYCCALAQAAVHAAFAGYAGVSVAKVDSSLVYLPMKLFVDLPRRVVDVHGRWFERLMTTTQQPSLEEVGSKLAKPANPEMATARTPMSTYRRASTKIRASLAFTQATDEVRVPDCTLKALDGFGEPLETRPLHRNDLMLDSDEIRDLTCFHLSERYGVNKYPSKIKLGSVQACDTFSWTTQALFLGDKVDSGKGFPYYKMVRAGARENLHFDPYDPAAAAAIVSCGGICPGLNSVIREIVMTLWDYGVRRIYGVIGGYKGVIEPENWITLTPAMVKDIHRMGGTMLISDRGNPPHLDMARTLQEKNVRQYFVLGGDGSHKGAMQTFDCCLEIDHECAVVGVPKTIDNDVPMFDQTFGFDSACTEAAKAVDSAYVEACCNANCIGLVKLMGRHCGFIAMNAALAARYVDICLLPEMDIDLQKVLEHTVTLMERVGHAVIVVAEGCGDTIIQSSGATDAGGNKVLADVGPWLKDQITTHFKQLGRPLTIKYIDPTYMIRSVPASCFDRVYCADLGRMAVHGAMAGYSGVTVGKIYERMVYLPIHAITMQQGKRVNSTGRWFQRMVDTTLQPDFASEIPGRPQTADGGKKNGNVLEALSKPGSINHLLRAGDTFERLHCCNLSTNFTPAGVPNPMHSPNSRIFLGNDAWSTQTLVRQNKRDYQGHKYLQMLRTGPRETIFFRPEESAAVLVTCGGLCPGLNSVIREIVMTLVSYGVKTIYGCKGGYKGMVEPEKWITLTADIVRNIHMMGGTVLVSDRGNPPHIEIAKTLQKMKITQYFVIGGDGTQTGAFDTFTCTQQINHAVAVVGVPKTIDNDIPIMDRSFGFNTACEEAVAAIETAYVEATCNTNCIGLVKLMGRHCGFIALHATLAARNVDICLLPEMDISLPKVFTHCLKLMREQRHAVIVVAEGCGDTLLKSCGERDAGGNKKLADVGPWLRDQLFWYFRKMQKPLTIKYIDPTYAIRAVPANANDSIYCSVLAQNAVHTAMAGYTGVVVGKVDERFVMLPTHVITKNPGRKVDLSGRAFQRMMATTRAPDLTPGVGDEWLLLPKFPEEVPEQQSEEADMPFLDLVQWRKGYSQRFLGDFEKRNLGSLKVTLKVINGFGVPGEEQSLRHEDLLQAKDGVRRWKTMYLSDRFPSRGVRSPLADMFPDKELCDEGSWVVEALSTAERVDSGKGIPYYQTVAAGPRGLLHFDPRDAAFRVAIVSTGGLCPGQNTVIRELVLTLNKYGVSRIYGIKHGFKGFIDPDSWCELTPELVKEINHRGGTILHIDRGNPPHMEMAEALRKHRIRQLFVLGGNGAHKGILQLCRALADLDYECGVMGVPSTIDNDMPMMDKIFGFDTACSAAKSIIDAAYVEATCNANCIGFVKLLGSGSGSLTVMSVLASRHVDLCLIPEMTVSLEKVLDHCEALMASKGYAVMVISDGCGEQLFEADGNRPEDGDVGPWLRDKVLKRFKDNGKPLTIKYLDPTYMLRSQPSNASDSVYCGMLAEHAVHGAMAGLTCCTTAKLHERYIYLPLNAVTTQSKRVNPQGRWYMRMRFTTQQPAFEPDNFEYASNRSNLGNQALEDISTEVPIEEVLLPGSSVVRLECANLGSVFPSKSIPNTVKSLSVEAVSDQTWSMQAVTQPNGSEDEPQTYLQMLRSGPRSVLHFDVNEPGASAAIVTCGGLCPGLNDVIRELTIMLQTYGVKTVYGIIGGFKGCVNEDSWITLTEGYIQNIHMKGGTILVSDRGNPPHSEIAKALQRRNVRQYFVIGGDGSHKGAMQSFEAMTELGHECAVVGIPKTIDNDITLVDRTFGYDTACEVARQAIDSGYVEATTNANCVGLVKLMGRHCGWIAAAASLASQHVDVCLIPEMNISLPKLLSHIASVLKRQKYAVVVVAEGCGDTLITGTGATDAGGNKLLADVGPYLKDEIVRHCKSNRIPVSIKYIDPTYMIRAVPANASDSIYCSILAQQAVHGAMAGYTGVTVGKVDERFVMLPIHSIVDKGSRKVGLTCTLYKRLIAATGQPNFSP